MHRQVLLALGFFLVTGCTVMTYLDPMTNRCRDAPGLPASFQRQLSDGGYWNFLGQWLLPGVEPGTTREQIRKIFQGMRLDPDIAAGVTLDDSDPDFFNFLAGTCPYIRYRFKNNHLVAVRSLVMEMGFFYHREMDYTEIRCDLSLTKTGYRIFRTRPTYDEHGDFIGVEKTDVGPHYWGWSCEGVKAGGK